jgi:hypothetical protein
MLRAYGDCVISYGLLEKLPASENIRIVGTRVSREVAEALAFSRYSHESVLDDVAAFFDVKQAGPRRALADLYAVRSVLREKLQPGDRVLFEHASWRNRWVLPSLPGIGVLEPGHGTSIYFDRREMLGRAFANLPDTPASRRPVAPIRNLVLNPGARLEYKRLPGVVVDNIVRYASERGIEVHLLDPEERHAHVAARVRSYRARPKLAEAIEMVRGADLYVGADSFFLHLAYRFDRPLFAIVPTDDPYFAPPSLATINGVITLARARNEQFMREALDTFCVGTASQNG